MRLSDLKTGESAVIVRVFGHGAFRKRLLEMGFVPGQIVTSVLNSPLKDPVKYNIMGYDVSLRHSEANMIETVSESEAGGSHLLSHLAEHGAVHLSSPLERAKHIIDSRKREITVALVGNPNSGKTSLFNALTGGKEHVGNYSGVTVDAKMGHLMFEGYRFRVVDLPGTYSLSAYSPEEKYVRSFLYNEMPDVIINSVVASNLERNLYITTELIDMSQQVVVALNMYDELEKSGAELDFELLGKMVGMPMVPVVAKTGRGIDNLLRTVLRVYLNEDDSVRHVHILYRQVVENEIKALSGEMKKTGELPLQFPPRYWSIKMLEGDTDIEEKLKGCPSFDKWEKLAEAGSKRIERQTGEVAETVISNEKYGFIDGALKETYTPGEHEPNLKTKFIDKLVTDRWLGFPIFFLLMWLMFTCTFVLGAYPQDWIQQGIDWLSGVMQGMLPEGPLKDLLVDGVIGGVGAVLVFLPNIVILYLFISLMEDSGYMARAAFIMDKIMHKIGLHGKSFIPLIMGFGCNVPAVMAGRTIESHSSRIITIFINPFMSCSARLPLYLLMAGIFFPTHGALVLVGMYFTGILVAIITARLLRHTLFKKDETPFVMELPPYRMPTVVSILRQMWGKTEQYLRKIGGVILIASVLIWALSYFPKTEKDDVELQVAQNTLNNVEADANAGSDVYSDTSAQINMVEEENEMENSYLGRIGKFVAPVMEPVGIPWKGTVALLTGTAAKEIVVSTMGVLYSSGADNSAADEDADRSLGAQLRASGDFNSASALAFMVFVLLYFPCIATLGAIANETGSWKWAVASALYNTAFAWVMAFIVYKIALLFI